MNLSNLPPGVREADIPGCCDDDDDLLHCSKCQAVLPTQPDSAEPFEDKMHCDGKVHVAVEEYDDKLIAILGEEFRGKTYEIRWVKCEDLEGHNCVEHEPHDVVMLSGITEHRRCPSCGHDNVYKSL